MNTQIHIWIDADSCPTLVRFHAQKIAFEKGLQISFVANKNIPGDEKYPFEMIICEQEKDAADNYILEHCNSSDLIITRDIVFADRLVSNNIPVINDQGTEFTKNNIKEILSDRDFDFALAQAGVVKHHSYGYTKKQFAAFANCFDKVLTKIINSLI